MPDDLGAGPVATLLAALVMVGVSLGVLWMLRRSGLGSSREGRIEVLASRSLGSRRAVTLVEVDGERFLLGVTEQNVSCLGRLDDASRWIELGADETNSEPSEAAPAASRMGAAA